MIQLNFGVKELLRLIGMMVCEVNWESESILHWWTGNRRTGLSGSGIEFQAYSFALDPPGA